MIIITIIIVTHLNQPKITLFCPKQQEQTKHNIKKKKETKEKKSHTRNKASQI